METSTGTPEPSLFADELKAERIQGELKAERIQQMLARHPGWEVTPDGHGLRRTFTLPTTRAASLFAALVYEIGLSAGTLPRLTLEDLEVTVWIASRTGVTELDFALARRFALAA